MRYSPNYRRRRNALDAALDWLEEHPLVGWAIATALMLAIGAMVAFSVGGVQ